MSESFTSEAAEASLNLPPGCWPQRFAPIGYTTVVSDTAEAERLAALAAQILDDPVALQRLGDRVLALLRHDLQQDRERRGALGRR